MAAAATDHRPDVQVFARFRPFNERESRLDPHHTRPVYHYSIKDDDRAIQVLRPSDGTEHEFILDGVFSEDATQMDVYERIAHPLVTQVLNGFNCTLMAYGQTGSGKSYTLSGPPRDRDEANLGADTGLVPRLLHDLFAAITDRTAITVQCSYVEIYMEKVRDLLNAAPTNLQLRELATSKPGASRPSSLVYIENCTVCTVQSWEDIRQVLRRGDRRRVTAATHLNEHSSRSHAVLVLHVTQTDPVKRTRRLSKLFLVDLAGSEQVSRSGAEGVTLEQAKKINRSLSTLALVIQALVERKPGSHIPYRDSKLTRLLTDSLGGNAKTVLLLTLSPAYDSLAETYATLGFGTRAKRMQNRAVANDEMTLDAYKQLVTTLGQDVEGWRRKYDESDQRYHELLERFNALATPAIPEEEAEQGVPLDQPPSPDNPYLVQTGNVVVVNLDHMFTFEPF